ncbi:MAG: hypothetical protein Salg2KO_00970 [Salibacteraceae bacterium]
MKSLLSTIALALFFLSATAGSANYRMNLDPVDKAFEASENITQFLYIGANLDHFSSNAPAEDKAKSQTTAAIIAFVVGVAGSGAAWTIFWIASVATGGIGTLFCWPILIAPLLPWHRFYLGTGGENFKLGALYCVTLNWFGWLGIIDGIFLLIDETDSKYIGSPKYIMWLDGVK